MIEQLVEGENLVRDCAVLRVQMLVPLRNRMAFIIKLREVFGDVLEDKNLFSSVMHAHRNLHEQFVVDEAAPGFLTQRQMRDLLHQRR